MSTYIDAAKQPPCEIIDEDITWDHEISPGAMTPGVGKTADENFSFDGDFHLRVVFKFTGNTGVIDVVGSNPTWENGAKSLYYLDDELVLSIYNGTNNPLTISDDSLNDGTLKQVDIWRQGQLIWAYMGLTDGGKQQELVASKAMVWPVDSGDGWYGAPVVGDTSTLQFIGIRALT